MNKATITIDLDRCIEDEIRRIVREEIREEMKRHNRDESEMKAVLNTKLSDFGISVRAFNCSKSAGIETVADLVSYERRELFKFRNYGRKTLAEMDILVEKLNLSFGMDVRAYGLIPHRDKAKI